MRVKQIHTFLVKANRWFKSQANSVMITSRKSVQYASVRPCQSYRRLNTHHEAIADKTDRRLVITNSLHNQQRHDMETKRCTVPYISKDSQLIRRLATRHFISGISSTDYTERRKPSLMYGHWYRHTSRTNPKVQYAFKISMTHWILQFALRIAVRSVLHRCASLDIHCWKLLSS